MFIDLIEERFDTLALGDSFVTISDAFEGAVFHDVDDPGRDLTASRMLSRGRRILFDSDEGLALWKESCRRVMARIRDICRGIRFVIIENYLSETRGDIDSREPFEDIAGIRRINECLAMRYSFLKSVLPEAVFISPARDEMYFTDKKYEYGAIPSHLNEIENRSIAERIMKEI